MSLPAEFAALASAFNAAVAQFTAESRLYALEGDAGLDQLMVERWDGREALSELYEFRVTALSLDAGLDLDPFIGQRAILQTTLSDGSRVPRSGLVIAAEQLGADGGLARYRLMLAPWLWTLSQSRHSRVFQDKSVMEIVEEVFDGYAAIAAWKWSDEVNGFLADARPRSYCVQYRESDYDFVARLLAEEGLGFRFEESADAPAGHTLILFAESVAQPQDACSEHALGGAGIRFHRAASQEEQDAIQTFGATRVLPHASVTVLSYDYTAKRAVAASAPTDQDYAAKAAPALESYDYAGVYAYASSAEATRYATLHMQAQEARNKGWFGTGSVRSFRAGTWFAITQSSIDLLSELAGESTDPSRLQFVLGGVHHVGVNNLPRAIQTTLSKQMVDVAADVDPELTKQAEARGYANRFTALRRDVPWRPVLDDATGLRANPRVTAPGVQSALVVGPKGETSPSGAQEIHHDALGRIRVRFHWQQGASAQDGTSCWLRVVTPSAGGGIGQQFIPRIGQEVLVGFLDGDIDRPIVLGALYNGQGEAGLAPSPGGAAAAPLDLGAYAQAADFAPTAQGNLAGGNAPAWHAGSSDAEGHRNAAGLMGFKSKEFGGSGYSQLVLDDHDGQQRVQLATTQSATQLNLGHLLHQADNYRGSFRGEGFELRTDAYGAVRGESGLLLTTYGGADPIGSAQPAGDFTAGEALLKQAASLSQAYSQAAGTHLTVKFAAIEGADKAGQSALDAKAAPLPALLASASTQVSAANLAAAQGDAAEKSTVPSPSQLPHPGDALLAISAQGGLVTVAGQDVQWTAGETLTLAQGQDLNLAVGNQWRLHTGQALGLLAGASKSGDGNRGLSLVAAQGPVSLQAQADVMKVQSKNQLKLVSANASLDFAAAKSVTLKTAQGAAIVIEGGNITVTCPGNLMVQAGKKSFVAAAQQNFPLPAMPSNVCVDCLLQAANSGDPLAVKNA